MAKEQETLYMDSRTHMPNKDSRPKPIYAVFLSQKEAKQVLMEFAMTGRFKSIAKSIASSVNSKSADDPIKVMCEELVEELK